MGWCLLRGAIATIALCSLSIGTLAQSYPQRPVCLIVPGAAGGPTDVPARLVAEGLSALVGQRFVVENRIGAGVIIAGETVARAEPNGYTLPYGNSSLYAINQALFEKMPYDPVASFVMIGMATNSPQLLVANPRLPYQTIKEFLDYAKANPGKINFASGGPATLPHLTYELMRLTTGLQALHVPYKGGAPAATAVIAGEADVLFDLIRTRVQSGELRALAITGKARDPDLPLVPTMAEIGYPEMTSTSWTGIAGPAGTPKEVVGYLNAKLNELIVQSEFRTKARVIGIVPQGGTPEEFAAHAGAERVKWARVVKESGAKAN
ncbi:MAG: tripartite tricarboxylate transporter substrate binding protein [Betaproteobacteria bacterium]|nr:tripartite tricarboxylate transporter substrate binding protein [Betaproteobacteria bacterium]